MDSGGSSGGGSSTTTNELPEWAKPYAKDTLEKGAALSEKKYEQYKDPRIAGFSDMQVNAQNAAKNMQTSGATGAGIGVAGQAALRALGTDYQGSNYGNQFQAPGAYQPGQFNANQVDNQGLNQYQMRGPQQVRSQNFGNQAAEDYMSPYMQNVVDVQQREAQRTADIAGTQRGAQAARMGAFGGSRQAIMDAEAARNLATQKGDIQATGQQAAFQNAQQQFNADQVRRMQAQQANQGAGLTAGQANLSALLGVQQLGAGQDLQAQLANQQYGLQAQQLGEQSRQFGAGQGLQAAGLGAQYGQAANQLNEQSKQYGAGLDMQGLQTALTGAGQLGALGGQQFQQGMDINKLQNAYGGQQQALKQQGLTQDYQDFQDEKNYGYKQLGFMSDMIRGLPLGNQATQQMYQSPGSIGGQIAGLGMGAYGMSRAFPGMFGAAEGGLTQSYADGGSVESAGNIESIVSKLSDEQLQQSMEAAQARGDQAQMQIIQAEMAMRASERNGMAGAYNSLPQEQQDGMAEMAGGGIVAFADEGLVKGKPIPERATSPMGDFLRSLGVEDAFTSAREYATKNIERGRQIDEANSIDPYFYESMTPTERKRRSAASEKLMKGDQSGKPLSQAELAAKYQEFKSIPSSSPYAAKSATLLDADDAESYAKQLGKGQKQDGKSLNLNSVAGQAKAAAKAAGIPAEDFETQMRRLRKEFEGEVAGYKKEMLDQYKKAADRLAENKSKAGYEALANFGFNMAAQAAKPGQARRSGISGVIESAGAAAPVLSQSMAESNKLNRAAEDNLEKMRSDQLRFEQALSNNDRQSAMQYANAISQDKKAQAMLDIERQKLGLLGQQAANASSTALQKIADDLQRSDPKLDRRAALGEASKIAGYSYRQDAASQGRLAETIRKIDEKFNMLDMLPPDSDVAKQMRVNRDRQIAEAKRQFGGEMQAGSGSTIKLDSKGNIIQ
jgi:hypothetical protein